MKGEKYMGIIPKSDELKNSAIISAIGVALACFDPTLISASIWSIEGAKFIVKEGLKQGLPDLVSGIVERYSVEREAKQNHSNLKLFRNSVHEIMPSVLKTLKTYLEDSIEDKEWAKDVHIRQQLLDPISEKLTNETFVKALFEDNAQLNPEQFIRKVIEDAVDIHKCFQVPNAETTLLQKDKQALLELIIETFRLSFIEHFKAQISSNTVARVSYHTHLLHSVVTAQKNAEMALQDGFEAVKSGFEKSLKAAYVNIKVELEDLGQRLEKGQELQQTKLNHVEALQLEMFELQQQVLGILLTVEDYFKSPPEAPLTYQRLRVLSKDQIGEKLNNKHAHFYKKYLFDVFQQRKAPQEAFEVFKWQSQARCFIVNGKAGKGKTSLLCHLANLQTLSHANAALPVLINGPELTLDKLSLESHLKRELGGADLTTVCDVLKEEKARLKREGEFTISNSLQLIVFIDAINEIEGEQAFDSFGKQLSELIRRAEKQHWPLLFCISCRSDFWQFFIHHEWVLEHTYAPENNRSQHPTFELKNYEEDEIDVVIEKYFKWYHLEGKPRGKARKDCADPIMLRYLCEAYTDRKSNDKQTPPHQLELRNVGRPETLQKKHVFDTFVKNIRKRMFDRVRIALKGELDVGNIEEYTTKYIINLARVMLEKRRPYITREEAMEVAKERGHTDAKLSLTSFDNSEKSIFFMFIDEGLILDEYNKGNYHFIFESYLEYSLGRYIALERWAKYLEQPDASQAIKNDLKVLLKEDITLSYNDEHRFTNLLGAIQYAILVTEDDDRFASAPKLFIDLIDVMLRQKGLHFIHVQKAFATLRTTALLSGVSQSSVQELHRDFNYILEVIYRFAKDSKDFVIHWDFENTLLEMHRRAPDLVLDHIYDWANQETNRVLQMFAVQVIAKTAKTDPNTVLKLFEKLMGKDEYRHSFWLSRTLIFGITEIAKTSEISLSVDTQKRMWHTLTQFIEDEETSMYTKDLAFSSLPFLVKSDYRNVRALMRYVDSNTISVWGLWNMIYHFKHWEAYDGMHIDSWVWDLLLKVIEREDPHLQYIIREVVLNCSDTINHEHYLKVKASTDNNVWSKDKIDRQEGRPLSRKKSAKTGLVYSPLYLEPAYDNHTECRQRLQAILDKIQSVDSVHYNWVHPKNPKLIHLESVHGSALGNDRHSNGSPWNNYLDEVMRASKAFENGRERHNQQVGPAELRFESFEVAKVSAGGVISAVDYVMNCQANVAWSLGRPPGHLANNSICVLNNIAIGAQYALEQFPEDVERILIIDCDAHHGKHTAKVFNEKKEVIYVSIHIEGGHANDEETVDNIGKGNGEGYTFNLTYPPYAPDEGYHYIVSQFLKPLMVEFEPHLIMISAGFDGHFDDELNPGGAFTERAYITLAETVKSVMDQFNCSVVGALEGGYGLDAMANSFVHMMRIIGAWDVPQEAIGFVEFQDVHVEPKALEAIKKMLAHRVALMQKTKEKNPNYTLFKNEETWNHLLD